MVSTVVILLLAASIAYTGWVLNGIHFALVKLVQAVKDIEPSQGMTLVQPGEQIFEAAYESDEEVALRLMGKKDLV